MNQNSQNILEMLEFCFNKKEQLGLTDEVTADLLDLSVRTIARWKAWLMNQKYGVKINQNNSSPPKESNVYYFKTKLEGLHS